MAIIIRLLCFTINTSNTLSSKTTLSTSPHKTFPKTCPKTCPKTLPKTFAYQDLTYPPSFTQSTSTSPLRCCSTLSPPSSLLPPCRQSPMLENHGADASKAIFKTEGTMSPNKPAVISVGNGKAQSLWMVAIWAVPVWTIT